MMEQLRFEFGPELTEQVAVQQANETCKVDGCENLAAHRGLCKSHYNKWYAAGGGLFGEGLRPPKYCSVDGCGKLVHCKGLCPAHYQARRLEGKPKRSFDISVFEKRCKACGTIKPAAAFNITRDNSDGLGFSCRECTKQKVSRMIAAKPEHFRAKRRAYQKANRERLNERNRAYQRENWPKFRESKRKWAYKAYQKDPDKFRKYNHARRARAAGNGGKCSGKDLQKLWHRHRGLCAYCGINKAETTDHVIPLSRGGTSNIGNLLPACGSCNSSKNNWTIMEWRMRRLRRQTRVGIERVAGMAKQSSKGVGLYRSADSVQILDEAPRELSQVFSAR